MTVPPNENEDVLASIRNPAVDAWNHAPEDRAPSATLRGSNTLTLTPGGFDPATRPPETTARPATAARSGSVPAVAAEAKAVTTSPLWVPVLVALGLLAGVSGLFDMFGSVVPGKLSNPNWRFGAAGALSPALVKPIFGASMVTLALISTQKRLLALLFMGFLSLVALGLVVIAPFFVLDALQVRPGLPEAMSGRLFILNVAFALSFQLLGAAVLVTCAWVLRKATLTMSTGEDSVVRDWDR